MAEQGGEQNKTEQASQFKLDRARKKGTVARGMDLGFLAMLLGLAAAAQMFGTGMGITIAQTARRAFSAGIAQANQPESVLALTYDLSTAMFWPVAVVGVSVALFVIFVDIVQLRGIIFSSHPLKPDFSRLNPAKGLKRIFSLNMLKQTGKNILKMAIYSGAAFLLVRSVLVDQGLRSASGTQLAQVMTDAVIRLLAMFIALAFFFAVLDQLIVRREFGKQMRMSRRELTRESREREGDPRQKQKRKQLHADYIKQSASVGHVAGSDVLIVNPDHYAVALIYKPETMEAPEVLAKGRNAFALRMRNEARRRGVVIVENPPLARALYKQTKAGSIIPTSNYAAVADIYIMLRRQNGPQERVE